MLKHRYGTTKPNADGSYTTELSNRPVHWKDPETGDWKTFDNTIQDIPAERARPGFGRENKSNSFRANFAGEKEAAAGRPLVRIATHDGRAVSMGLQGARPTNAQVSGSQMTYPDAFAGVDVRYTVDGERIKEDVVLRSADAVRTLAEASGGALKFTFDLALEGLTAVKSPNGTIAFSDGAGKTHFVMPRPFMVDSADTQGRRANTGAVSMGVTQVADSQVRLELVPDLAWLLDRKRVYPVLVDPTLTLTTDIQPDGTTGKDSFIHDYGGNANNNYGSGTSLLVGQSIGGGGEEGTWVEHYQTLLEFSGFDALTRGMVSSATLSLYATGAGNVTIGLLLPTAPWSENTVTWNNRPGNEKNYGGGATSQVNLSTGNLVVQHVDSSIPARGVDVSVVHTYNSQDIYGTADESGNPNAFDDAGDYFGAGWTMSYNVRLVEYDSGNAVRIKDGTGQWRVYYKDTDTGNTRTYKRPLYFGHTLTKDLATPPADANKVFTFTTENGLTRHFFTAGGLLTKIQDRPNGNGNALTFTYDGNGKLTTITDMASRTTTLAYSGSPALLSSVTDMASRVSTFAYTSGRLTSITHASGTVDAVTTYFGYDAAGQLVDITNPRDHIGQVTYRLEAGWETGGAADGWAARSGCAGSSVSQSTTRAFSGSGSLALGFSGNTCGGAVKALSPAAQLNPIRQELVAYLYVPTGATDVTAKLYVKDRLGSKVDGTSFTGFTADTWNRLHWIDAPIDPSNPPTEIGVEVTRGSAYTGTLYLDHVHLRGVTYQQKDALAAHNVVAEYSYAPTIGLTHVKRPDQDGTLRTSAYAFNGWGWPIAEMQGDAFDTFDRPDGLLTAATAASGHAWTAESGSSIKIESNIVRQDNGASKIAYVDTGASDGGNVTLSAQVRNKLASAFVGLALRVVDTSNHLYIVTQLYTKAFSPQPDLGTGWYTIRIDAQDNDLEVWVNNTSFFTYTLGGSDASTFSNAVAKHGLYFPSSTSALVDDFTVNGRLTLATYDGEGRLLTKTPPPPHSGTVTSETYTYYTNTNFVQTMTDLAGGASRYGIDTTNGDLKYALPPVQVAAGSSQTTTYYK
ncbi:MAG: DNRLRE domain-containing protein, partial [Chloroflexi bacterium]|nr:DNRLRE domain-containing protein [Chloroflexota bacterium]